MIVSVPLIDRGILAKLLQGWLPAGNDPVPPLVLVSARYVGSRSGLEVSVPASGGPNARTYQVSVTDQPSVLGVVDAWHRHRTDGNSDGDRGDVLVVTTAAGEADLGWELRRHALRGKVWTVDRAELVRSRFQAPAADPRIARKEWLVDGLLAAEPATGWRPVGGVLTLDLATAALVAARLGVEADRDGWDITSLLDWSRRPGAPDRYATLDQAEQDGIAGWLADQVGPGASLLLALAASGRGRDAMPLGVICSLAALPGVPAEAAMALGGLLGGVTSRPGDLRSLAAAVGGTLTRWASEAAGAREPWDSDPGMRVLDVVHRADELAVRAGLTAALSGHALLPSSLDHQVRQLARALTAPVDPAAPSGDDIAAAETALTTIARHELVQLDTRRLDVATMAVRLQRWLATPEVPVTTVADALRRQAASWGWVDRALDLVWSGDPSGDGATEAAYRRVHDAARARRDHLDEQFAACLVTWAEHACSAQPGGCLLIEDVLATIVAPLARRDDPAPLVLVLDGMSSAVATELAAQAQARGWTEVSPHRGRRAAAVSMLPSVTRFSRTSLLSGRAVSGDQSSEDDGFTGFWTRHGHQGRLFHKGDLPGRAGQRISDTVMEALSGDAVVGIVLNTIDDALDHGQEGDRTGWTLRRVTYLHDLLDAARGYGRPVVLTSDHGHVLDRSSPGEGPTTTDGVQSARWRTGVPGPGETAVTGPRVLATGGAGGVGGQVVLPWRETIRYTPRKAGYHGGAALAEVTVPVAVFLPDPDRMPAGWSPLGPDDVTPPWWSGRSGQTTGPAQVEIQHAPVPRRRRPAPPTQGDTLFEAAGLDLSAQPAPDQRTAQVPQASLGQRVAASEVYAAQKTFIRKPPDKQDVARVIDVLAAASGTLPVATVATLVGRAGRRADQVVVMLERLLNVEGYEVLARIDGGRTLRLNLDLLRQQFRLGEAS